MPSDSASDPQRRRRPEPCRYDRDRPRPPATATPSGEEECHPISNDSRAARTRPNETGPNDGSQPGVQPGPAGGARQSSAASSLTVEAEATLDAVAEARRYLLNYRATRARHLRLSRVRAKTEPVATPGAHVKERDASRTTDTGDASSSSSSSILSYHVRWSQKLDT
eukprot:Selendium_serpulae@DN1838_c0_g1_i1.p1